MLAPKVDWCQRAFAGNNWNLEQHLACVVALLCFFPRHWIVSPLSQQRSLFVCLFVFMKCSSCLLLTWIPAGTPVKHSIGRSWKNICEAQTVVSFQIQPFHRTARAPTVTLKSDSLVSFHIIQNNSCELKDKATFCNRFCSSTAHARLRESISNQMFHEQSLICCLFLSTLCLPVILCSRTWSSHFCTSSFLGLAADAVPVPSVNDTIGWVPSESEAGLAYHPANCMKSSVHLASLFIQG